MPYSINEPQPAAPHGVSYVHTGRGGAGNYQASSTTAGAAVTEAPLPPPPSSGKFLTGRGGSGNAHAASERPMFFFDEDMERVSANVRRAPVFHVGRGGAGNCAHVEGTTETLSGSTAGSHPESPRPSFSGFGRGSKDSTRGRQSVGSQDDADHGHVQEGVWQKLGRRLSGQS